MNLQRKSLLLFVLLYLALCTAVGVMLRSMVMERFDRIETATIGLELRRAGQLLMQEAERLQRFARDWGEWDDSWNYSVDRNPDFEQANLIPESLEAINADGLFLLDSTGQVLWSRLQDPQSDQHLSSETLNNRRWPVDHPLLQISREQPDTGGILDTDLGPVVFGRSPILRSDGSGPARGFLVFVRFLRGPYATQLNTQMQLQLDLSVIGKRVDTQIVAPEFIHDNKVIAYRAMPLTGHPGQYLQMRAEFERPVHMQALETIRIAIWLIFAIGLLFSVIGYYVFQRHLILPIVHLTEKAAEFGRRKNELPAPLFRSRFDEVGELARTLQEMARSIRSQQEKLIDERRKAEMDSWTDPLTGLHNRRFLQQFLSSSELPAAEPVWLFLSVDIDHFKSINDNYGHDVGDLVLCQFSTVIKSCIRNSDTAIRMGGEEFMLVCRESSREQGMEIAERLRQLVARTEFGVESDHFNLTCSIGYLSCEMVERESLRSNWRSIMRLTDMALYAAKRSGRDTWIGLNCLDQEVHRWFPESLEGLQDKLRLQQISVSSSTPRVIWS